mgnify:CR=1 FL=1
MNSTSKCQKSRFTKIVFSSGSAIVLKVVTFICSFILTRLIIKTYGSDVNGMIGSITQFLGFITLLEGGIGGVARAVLYKPLAEKNNEQICKVITYIERFFRIIALVFIVYAIIVAFIFPVFAEGFDFWFSFSLVLILSASSFCEYFFGISYAILINADQKNYVTNYFSFFITILTFVASLILIKFGFKIHIVKIVSVFILIMKPILLSIYCKNKYNLTKVKLDKNENILPQKWSGIGVHVAYYLHRNTDTFLITIFLSLSMVSVYSVYNMIIGGVLTVIESLSLGIEAAFGNMNVNGEFENLKSRFKLFVSYYQFLCTLLLSCTVILIIPFVRLYTSSITDADYVQPLFAILFVSAEFLYCLRVPYNNLMVATNSFKEIRFGAYIEVCINLLISIILVHFFGINGVVIGTICAMLFRLAHYLWFFKRKKLNFEISWFIRTTICSFFCYLIAIVVSAFDFIKPLNYIVWCGFGFITIFAITLLLIFVYFFFDRTHFGNLLKFIKMKLGRKKHD